MKKPKRFTYIERGILGEHFIGRCNKCKIEFHIAVDNHGCKCIKCGGSLILSGSSTTCPSTQEY